MRKRLVATGRFLTILPSYAVTPHGSPSLKRLPVALSETHGAVGIVTLKNRTLSPLGELFVKTARTVTKPLAKAR
jgi:DNA-binding transcriptional LysR family regulator